MSKKRKNINFRALGYISLLFGCFGLFTALQMLYVRSKANQHGKLKKAMVLNKTKEKGKFFLHISWIEGIQTRKRNIKVKKEVFQSVFPKSKVFVLFPKNSSKKIEVLGKAPKTSWFITGLLSLVFLFAASVFFKKHRNQGR